MPAVLGDVQAGVVAQIDGGVPEFLSEPRTIGGLGAAAVAIRVQPPRFLGFAQTVNEDRHLRGRLGEGDLRERRAEARRLLGRISEPSGSPTGCPGRQAHLPGWHSALPMPDCSGESTRPEAQSVRRGTDELAGGHAGDEAGPSDRGVDARGDAVVDDSDREAGRERSMRTPGRRRRDAPARRARRCQPASAPPAARWPASPQASSSPPKRGWILSVWHSEVGHRRMHDADRGSDGCSRCSRLIETMVLVWRAGSEPDQESPVGTDGP